MHLLPYRHVMPMGGREGVGIEGGGAHDVVVWWFRWVAAKMRQSFENCCGGYCCCCIDGRILLYYIPVNQIEDHVLSVLVHLPVSSMIRICIYVIWSRITHQGETPHQNARLLQQYRRTLLYP